MNYEVIKAVCETGNLSKAAKMLNYSQSAVSQTIQNYEKQLGITLFERSKTGVKPLPGVLPIIESVKKIADEEKKIKEFAESIRDLEQGVVRIGSLTRIVTKWLPDIFAQLERDYPNIRYQLETGSLYELQDYLENDKADFALMSSLAAKNYAFTPIVKDEMMVLLPKGHPLAAQESVNIQELKKENFMITSEGLDFEIGDILKSIGINEGNAKYRFNDDIIIMKFVELGLGVSILPKLFLDIIGEGFDMEIRSLTKPYYRILGIAYPNKTHMPPVATKFIDYMLKWFKQNRGNIDDLIL